MTTEQPITTAAQHSPSSTRSIGVMATPEVRSAKARRRHDLAAHRARHATMGSTSSISEYQSDDEHLHSSSSKRHSIASLASAGLSADDPAPHAMERTLSEPVVYSHHSRRRSTSRTPRTHLLGHESQSQNISPESVSSHASIDSPVRLRAARSQQRDDERWINLLERQNQCLLEQLSTMSRDVTTADVETTRIVNNSHAQLRSLHDEVDSLRQALDEQTRRHASELANFRAGAIKQKIAMTQAVEEAQSLIAQQESSLAAIRTERQELADMVRQQDTELLRLRRRVGALAEEMLQKRWLESTMEESSRSVDDMTSMLRSQQQQQHHHQHHHGLHTPRPSLSILARRGSTSHPQIEGSPIFSDFLPPRSKSSQACIPGPNRSSTLYSSPATALERHSPPPPSAGLRSPRGTPLHQQVMNHSPSITRTGVGSDLTDDECSEASVLAIRATLLALWHEMRRRGWQTSSRLLMLQGLHGRSARDPSNDDRRPRTRARSITQTLVNRSANTAHHITTAVSHWAHFILLVLIAGSILLTEGPSRMPSSSIPTGRARGRSRSPSTQVIQ
ncbi:hypothetical protein PYCC9005_002537 [Savitreella phatthalungensis]